MDSSLAEKDEEISHLRDELARLCQSSTSAQSGTSEESGHTVEDGGWPRAGHSRVRWGKAPPVDAFTGEDRVPS